MKSSNKPDEQISNLSQVTDGDAVKIILGKLDSWWESAASLIPNFVVALCVLIVFLGLATLVAKFSRRGFSKASLTPTVTNIFSRLVFLIVFGVGIFIALGLLQLDKTIASVLAGAGVLGLAIGFAFQEIASNLLSGLFIAFEKPFKVGDVVKVDEHLGSIQSIRLRTTVVQTFDALNVIVPNKRMFTDIIVNYTDTEDRRVDIECGVSYSDDLDKVKQVVVDALSELEGRNKNKDVAIFFKEFGGSSINFVAHVWIEYASKRNYLSVRDEAIRKIKKAFDGEEISIPFPIRTLDFSGAGGPSLRDSLSVDNQGVNAQ